MFVQHHSHTTQVSSQVNNAKSDFDLIIKSKNNESINGKISFTYLNQPFEAGIIITYNSIQIKAQQPFAGIQASAPFLTNAAFDENKYLNNGSITKSGHQNIIWLILDVIHLYNLLRLKPGSILDLYREAFNHVKLIDSNLVFGKIDLESKIAIKAGKALGQKMKRQHKYAFGSNLDLLASFQDIIANYPQQLEKAPKVNRLDWIFA